MTMALEPDKIDLDALPHAFGGGFKREPVQELLQRISSGSFAALLRTEAPQG